MEQCAAHPLVREVLVINNAREPLPWVPPKVRVLQQAENIFVNPAWNLGAREARSDYLAIINDDIQFDDGLLDYTARILAHPWVGLVVPATTNRRPAPHERPRARLTYERKWGQGIFMAMRREYYVPVPSDLLVFSGDDWLFYQQPHRRNVEVYGVWVATEMSNTVDSEKKFSELGLADMATYEAKYRGAEDAWRAHYAREVRVVNATRWTLNRARTAWRPIKDFVLRRR